MTNGTKKMTKAMMFEQIKANYDLTADEIAFIDHELELLAKKNAADKKPTAQQTANAAIVDAIYNGMESGTLYTVTELIKSVPELAELTNQKVSPLCNALVKEGKMCKETEKGRTYFYVEC